MRQSRRLGSEVVVDIVVGSPYQNERMLVQKLTQSSMCSIPLMSQVPRAGDTFAAASAGPRQAPAVTPDAPGHGLASTCMSAHAGIPAEIVAFVESRCSADKVAFYGAISQVPAAELKALAPGAAAHDLRGVYIHVATWSVPPAERRAMQRALECLVPAGALTLVGVQLIAATLQVLEAPTAWLGLAQAAVSAPLVGRTPQNIAALLRQLGSLPASDWVDVMALTCMALRRPVRMGQLRRLIDNLHLTAPSARRNLAYAYAAFGFHGGRARQDLMRRLLCGVPEAHHDAFVSNIVGHQNAMMLLSVSADVRVRLAAGLRALQTPNTNPDRLFNILARIGHRPLLSFVETLETLLHPFGQGLSMDRVAAALEPCLGSRRADLAAAVVRALDTAPRPSTTVLCGIIHALANREPAAAEMRLRTAVQLCAADGESIADVVQQLHEVIGDSTSVVRQLTTLLAPPMAPLRAGAVSGLLRALRAVPGAERDALVTSYRVSHGPEVTAVRLHAHHLTRQGHRHSPRRTRPLAEAWQREENVMDGRRRVALQKSVVALRQRLGGGTCAAPQVAAIGAYLDSLAQSPWGVGQGGPKIAAARQTWATLGPNDQAYGLGTAGSIRSDALAALVWRAIHAVPCGTDQENMRRALVENLAQCIEPTGENATHRVCPTGVSERLMLALHGYVPEVQLVLMTPRELVNEVAARLQQSLEPSGGATLAQISQFKKDCWAQAQSFYGAGAPDLQDVKCYISAAAMYF